MAGTPQERARQAVADLGKAVAEMSGGPGEIAVILQGSSAGPSADGCGTDWVLSWTWTWRPSGPKTEHAGRCA
jgi:hypothetical protein